MESTRTISSYHKGKVLNTDTDSLFKLQCNYQKSNDRYFLAVGGCGSDHSHMQENVQLHRKKTAGV